MKCLIDGVIKTAENINICFASGGAAIIPQSDYPSFNTDFFLLINGFILLSFITGHFSGRIVRWMSKI